MGEGIGFATLGNVLLIGTFLDVFEGLNIVPYANNLFTAGIIMMLIGIILAAIATVLYLKPALGSGPRDGLMLAINKTIIKICRCNKNNYRINSINSRLVLRRKCGESEQ